MASDEVYVGPAEVYLAPVGEAFPAIDDVPAGNWDLHGILGSDSQTEDGVTVRRTVANSMIYSAGSTLPRKAVITTAGLEVEYNLFDITAEQIALGFGVDPADITTVAAASGVAGEKSFVIPTSPRPIERAVLVRIPASADGAFNSQFEIAAAVQLGSAEGSFNKNGPYTFGNLWAAIRPSSGDAFAFRTQTAAALA